ncbi:MAG TPA: TetR/AcrR family transcriptional regulator [Polyangiaceae bacterium]|jgi:TetR/AcrR family transcriptional repressor of nem operon|nr:TetR/AcrR family transcriptional regulator [Polyangiaceae bacterium]
MRYPDGHRESVRMRIVEAASRALRRDGLDAVSIPKLMKLVGLTHGGFYVHFRDRDELVAEAVAYCTKDSALASDVPTAEAFAKYLSQDHVRHPERGCVIAALGIEGARLRGPVRRAFAEAATRLLRGVERRLHPKGGDGTLSDEALATASRIVGAVVLARLVQDEALANRLLESAKGRA